MNEGTTISISSLWAKVLVAVAAALVVSSITGGVAVFTRVATLETVQVAHAVRLESVAVFRDLERMRDVRDAQYAEILRRLERIDNLLDRGR